VADEIGGGKAEYPSEEKMMTRTEKQLTKA
jgi:hypothetical protein